MFQWPMQANKKYIYVSEKAPAAKHQNEADLGLQIYQKNQ